MWLTIGDAAKRVGKSPDTIYRWIRRGKLQKYEMSQGASVMEKALLEVDRDVRQRRGRPRLRVEG